MRRTICSILFLSVTLPVFCRTQDVHLSYTYAEGSVYRYRDVLDVNSAREVMEHEVKEELNTVQVLRFRTESVGRDGSMSMTVTIDSARVAETGPGLDTTRIQDEILGRQFTFILGISGEVSKFASPDPTDGEILKVMQHQIGRFPSLGGAAIEIGSKWNKSSTDTIDQSQIGGRLIADTNEEYTLAGIEKKNGATCYKLTSSGILSMMGSGSMHGVDLRLEGTGKTTGTHYIDASRGILVLSETIVDIDMTVGAVGQEQMVLPETQSVKISRTLISE